VIYFYTIVHCRNALLRDLLYAQCLVEMNAVISVDKSEKPRPRWSTVWLHCTDLKNGKAVCNLCGTGLAYHSHISKSTYNLKRHLRLKHPTVIMPRRHKSSSMMWKFRREEDSKRSSVWAHCTIIGDKKVRCDLCKAELVYLNGSTHNLKRHLEAKHTAEEMQNYSKSHKAEQELQELINLNAKRMSNGSRSSVLSSAITEALNGYIDPVAVPSKYSWEDDDSDCEFVAHKPVLSLTKQRYFDDALIDTLALDFQPGTIVNDIGFREFVAQLQPLYVLPRRRTVCKTLFPQRFERLRHRRQMELQHVHAVCLSIENWNRINSSDHCFAVTAHFIGQQFELRSCALDCFWYSSQHTITYVKDELVRIAEEWHIQDKIVAVVTNSVTEVLTAIDLIGWPRLPCFVDTLNTIASEALLEIDEILMKIRSTVEYFRFNGAATEMLRSLLQQMEMVQMDLEPDRNKLGVIVQNDASFL
jgi:BED zinc finger